MSTLVITNSSAQTRIKFSVTDSISKIPLYGASINILDKMSGINSSGMADEKGEKTLTAVPRHLVNITISYVGYKQFVKEITVANDTVIPIFLIIDKNLLSEVTIKNKRGIIVKPDRLIYIVDQKDAKGKNVVDVLRNVPFVSITSDNMLIKGNSNYQILQDDRISTLSINDLRAMPASRIQSIELITVPSAKYEGQYENVLNIKLKKTDDYIGDISFARIGTRNSGVGTSFTKTNEKANTTVSVNLGYDITKSASQNQTRISKDTLFIINQNGISHQRTPSVGAKYDSEYTLSTDEFIGFGANFNYQDNRLTAIYESTISPINLSTLTNNSTDTKTYNIGLSGNYAKKIGKKNKLSFSNLVQLNNDNYNLTSQSTTPFVINSKNKNTEITSQLDDEITIGKGTQAEVGEKIIFRNYLHTPINDDSLDSKFKYDQSIIAGYLSISKTVNQFYIRVGSRLEETLNYYGTTNYNSLNFLPNALFSYSTNKGKTNSISLSFRRTLKRPSFQLLSTFIDRSTPLGKVTGNPELKNELADIIRISDDCSLGDNSISVAGFYTFGQNVINSERSVYSYFTDIIYNNSGSSRAIGGEVSYNRPLLKNTLFINFSGSIKHYSISGMNQSNNGFISSLNAGFSYNPSPKFSLDLFANYLDNYIALQSKIGHTVFSDLLARYQVKKSSFLIQLTNPIINRINESTNISAPFFKYTGRNTFFGRNIAIGYAYSFGRTKDRDEGTRKVENNDVIDDKSKKKL